MGIFDDGDEPFRGQKYKDLKSQCIKKGVLFTDSLFPPSGRSLYYSRSAPGDVVWKRPTVSLSWFHSVFYYNKQVSNPERLLISTIRIT